MMTCPRCGFVQPPDRFCAQCGLDVERYTPAKKSAVDGLLLNTWIQAAIIVMIVAATSFYIFEKKRATVMSQQLTESLPVRNNPQPTVPAAAKVQMQQPPPPKAEVAQDAAAKPEVIGESLNNPTAPLNAVAKTQTITTIKLNAVELSTQALTTLVEGTRSVENSSGMKAYVIKNWTTQVQKLRDGRQDIDELDTFAQPLAGNPAVEWDKMAMDPVLKEPVGLQILATPSNMDPASGKITVKIERSLREVKSATQVQKNTLNWSVEDIAVQPNQVLLIAGLLPRRKLYPDEEVIFAPTFLRFMAAPEFQNGLSDIALIVETTLQP